MAAATLAVGMVGTAMAQTERGRLVAQPATQWFNCPGCGRRVLGIAGRLGPCIQCQSAATGTSPTIPNPVDAHTLHAASNPASAPEHPAAGDSPTRLGASAKRRRQGAPPPSAGSPWVWAGVAAAVIAFGLAVVGAFFFLYDPYLHEALNRRLAAGDADGEMGPYALELKMEGPYAGMSAAHVQVDPAARLAAWDMNGTMVTVDVDGGYEYHATNPPLVYRDYAEGTPLKVLLGREGYHVVECDGAVCTGDTTLGSFELEHDDSGRFTRLVVRNPGRTLTAMFSYDDAVRLEMPAGAQRAATDAKIVWSSSRCGLIGEISCSPYNGKIASMRHAVRPDEIEVKLVGPNDRIAVGTLANPVKGGDRGFHWQDSDKDKLVNQGDVVVYTGTIDFDRVQITDLWAQKVIFELEPSQSTPSVGMTGLVVVIAAAAVLCRRTHALRREP